jgi:hypothetical protein
MGERSGVSLCHCATVPLSRRVYPSTMETIVDYPPLPPGGRGDRQVVGAGLEQVGEVWGP